MTDDHANCLDILYAFIAGFSVAALTMIGLFTGLGGFACH